MLFCISSGTVIVDKRDCKYTSDLYFPVFSSAQVDIMYITDVIEWLFWYSLILCRQYTFPICITIITYTYLMTEMVWCVLLIRFYFLLQNKHNKYRSVSKNVNKATLQKSLHSGCLRIFSHTVAVFSFNGNPPCRSSFALLKNLNI